MDDCMSELDRQKLSNRSMMYINRKDKKLDNKLKTDLINVTVAIESLPSITINGKIIVINEKYN